MPIDIELYNAICEGDFKKAYNMVKKNPALAKGRDKEKGDTLLHRMAVDEIVNNALQDSKGDNCKDLKELVSELIKSDPAILLVRNKKGRTALSLAINPPSSLVQKETVFYLLNKCPRAAKLKDTENHTALHHAIISGNFDVIAKLMETFHGALQEKDHLGQIPLATALRLYLDTPCDIRMSILRQVLDFTVISHNARDVLIRVRFNNDFLGKDLWQYATDFCIQVRRDTHGKEIYKVNKYLVDFVKYAANSVNSYFFGSDRKNEALALAYVINYASGKFDKAALKLFKDNIHADVKYEQHRTATLASINLHVKSVASVNLRTIKPLLNRGVIPLDEKKKDAPLSSMTSSSMSCMSASFVPSTSTAMPSISTAALQGLSLMRKKKDPTVPPVTEQGIELPSTPSSGFSRSIE